MLNKALSKSTNQSNITKLKVSRRRKITKIKMEINKLETKKIIENINENKTYFFEKIKFTNLWLD